MTEQQMKSISVDDLFSSGKISRKTYNTLMRARMRNVFDLKRYESGLPRLFRSGASGIREITVLLRELDTAESMPEMTSMLFTSPEPEVSRGEQLVSSLSSEEITLLDIAYRRQILAMQHSRERTATKMANALLMVPVTTFVRDFLLEDDDRILMLNEVGEVSMPQIRSVKEVLNREIAIVREEGIPAAYRILVYEAGGLLDDDPFPLESFHRTGRLPVLYLMQAALMANKDNVVVKAFLQRYDIFGGKVQVDDSKIGKSAFTITTYSNTVYDALFTVGASSEVMGNFFCQYVVNTINTEYLRDYFTEQTVFEDSESVRRLIEEEHLLFEPMCVVAILGKLLYSRYQCLGGYARSFGMAMDERWNHSYLVSKEAAGIFDFQRELWKFRDSVVRMSTETHPMDLDAYVRGLLEDSQADEAIVETISEAFCRIAKDELMLETDEQGMAVIVKTRDKSLADRLYDILKKKGEPMILDQLTECINSSDGRRYVRASVSLALNRDPRFQGSGKKGCYALSEWQLPYFGSNADIVRQVLEKSGRPMRSDEVVAELTAYSYNSQFSKNDLSSVVSLGKGIFCKLGLGYYGLVGYDYPPEDITPQKRSFESEMNALRVFFAAHHSVPKADGDEEERRLYSWYTRKCKEWEGDNNWSETKKAAFAALMEEYDRLSGSASPEGPEGLESPEAPESSEGPEAPKTSEVSLGSSGPSVPLDPLDPLAPLSSSASEQPAAEPEPTAEQPAAEQPAAEEPAAEPEPTAEPEPASEQPASEQPAAEPEPTAEQPAAEPEPASEQPAAEPEPASEHPAAEPEPIFEQPAAEPEPISEQPAAEPEPISEQPAAEPELTSEQPAAEPEPISEHPAAEPEPISEQPASEPEPISELPASEPELAEVQATVPVEDIAEWEKMAEKVQAFVATHGREPLAMFTVEVTLAEWLACQKQRLHASSLSERQSALLLRIRDMLW